LTPNEARQLQMLDIYPEYRDRDVTGQTTTRHSGIYVEIVADAGVTGIFGPIFAETAVLVRQKLAPYLIGADPLATERLWDVLYRQDRHARKGYAMLAISAVDCALWDLRGKVHDQPVYRLLGGPTRATVACYASMLGHSLDLGRVRERARWAVEQGYRAQKWFFRHGPADGLTGIEQNLALARTVRETVGPEIDIMFDCFMGGDVAWATRLAQGLAEVKPRWLEEPVPPDRIGDFAALRQASSVPIATGEHEYTRWGFLTLLQAQAVDVLQADPDWCGGISELVKIGVLASAYGRPVVPHGHSLLPALHVIASQTPTTFPMAEYLILAQPAKQHFHQTFLQPVGGVVALPTLPGLGIVLDESKIDDRSEL
jgi:L-alanine-DL-glutamate epimerase-like enolase superfamily enzyme